jgi:hypothetical protein
MKTDRSTAIRRAASLPKGSPERRNLLASLNRQARRLDDDEVAVAVDQISELTDSNYHTEALKVLADLLDDRNAKKILAHIEAISNIVGHTPQGLIQIRMHYIYKPLLKQAKSKLSPEQYDAVHGAL